MGLALGALSGILSGLAGVPAGMKAGTEADQRQQQIDLQRQQMEGVDTTSIGIPGRTPRELIPYLASLAKTKEETARKGELGQGLADQLIAAGTTTSMAPGSSLQMPQPGALMAPPAQDPMPAMTQRTVDPKMAALAKFIPQLAQLDPHGATRLVKDQLNPSTQLVGENVQGFLRGGKYTPLEPASPPAPFMPPADYKPTYTVDRHNRVSTTYRPNDPKPERTLSERLALAEEQSRLNPNDPQAQQNVARLRDAFANEEKLAGAKAGAVQAQKPPEEGDRVALAAQNNILASTELFKQFKPEEIKAYIGLLNRPVAEAKQALAATFGIGQVDQRFADFKALMGRLQGTAFGEGGKQLTGIELSVIQQYTPTGREAGGVPEIMAKIKNLEAFTRIARATRIKLAQTGRAALDPDAFDASLLAEMDKAGLRSGTPATEMPAAMKGAESSFNNVKQSFKEWQMEQGRR